MTRNEPGAGDCQPAWEGNPKDAGSMPDTKPGATEKLASKIDRIIERISKLIQTNAGLSASLATLNFTVNLATYLLARSPSRAQIVASLSSFLCRSPPRTLLDLDHKPPSVSYLASAGALLSDLRKSLRLMGLIPLYLKLRALITNRTAGEKDSLLHHIVLLQCFSYITFQSIENIYHLHSKGVISPTVVGTRGGLAKWIAWCGRAWCVGIVCEFFRLWREAQLEKKKRSQTVQRDFNFDRNWWGEFIVVTCWLPVAIHTSFYPKGIPRMDAGTTALLSLVASSNNFKKQWQSTTRSD